MRWWRWARAGAWGGGDAQLRFASRCEARAWASYRCVSDLLFVVPRPLLSAFSAAVGSPPIPIGYESECNATRRVADKTLAFNARMAVYYRRPGRAQAKAALQQETEKRMALELEVAKLEAELAAKDQIKKAYDEGFKMAKEFFKEMHSMKQN